MKQSKLILQRTYVFQNLLHCKLQQKQSCQKLIHCQTHAELFC